MTDEECEALLDTVAWTARWPDGDVNKALWESAMAGASFMPLTAIRTVMRAERVPSTTHDQGA